MNLEEPSGQTFADVGAIVRQRSVTNVTNRHTGSTNTVGNMSIDWIVLGKPLACLSDQSIKLKEDYCTGYWPTRRAEHGCWPRIK